jgi:hypothetical protein
MLRATKNLAAIRKEKYSSRLQPRPEGMREIRISDYQEVGYQESRISGNWGIR